MRTLIVTARQCPINAIGVYGNDSVATPTLDRLAADGITWDQHFSDAPDPVSAGRAWRGGCHQTPGLRNRNTPMIDLLNHKPHAVLVHQPRAESHGEFYAGWRERFDAHPDPGHAPHSRILDHLPEAFRAAGESGLVWLDWDAFARPWYIPQDVFDAYLDDESTETLEPWSQPPTGWFDRDDLESWEYLHRSFAAAMTTFDVQLGEVFQHLRDFGIWESLRVVFTTDHGLPLGEHGQIGWHVPMMHEEGIHLPLIIREPGDVRAGRRYRHFTQPADILPTLLGRELPGIDGRNVFDLTASRESVVGGRVQGSSAEWYLRTRDRQFLFPVGQEDREPLLYAKPEDRFEVNDLRPRQLDEAEALEIELRKQVECSLI
jgi:Sulfatase